ncbi:hypothetical protein FACS1894188_08800 [Clostridia bacterium]|nr:hypothetical protein FACS1894188_08800 [Clostridia bacterium]
MSKKRVFIENPALSYLSDPNEKKEIPAQTAFNTVFDEPKEERKQSVSNPNLTYKEVLLQFEPRSKRLQCLIQPSLYENLQKIATKHGISINELIHRTLADFIKSEKCP